MFVRKYIKQEEAEPKEAGPAFTPEEIAALVAERDSLKAHHTKLLDETKAAKAAKAEQEKAARDAALIAAKESGESAALNKSWTEKHELAKEEWSNEKSVLRTQLESVLVGGVASSMASKIAVQGIEAAELELLTNAIASNLKAVEKDGKLTTGVFKNNEPSALTLEELETEIRARYPRLMKGPPASGAGGFAKEVSGGAADGTSYSKMTAAQKAALIEQKYANKG